MAWLAVLLSTLALFAAAVPVRQAQLLDTMRNLSPSQELVLWELGATGEQHARVVLFIEVAVPALFFAVALLIFWQRSDDWVAMLVSAGLVTYITRVSPPLDTLAALEPDWRLPATIVQVLGMTCVFAFLYVFPDGRFVPGWTRLLLGAWALWAVVWVLFPGSPFDLSDPFRLSLVSFGSLMLWLSTAFGAQAYRFARVATPLQRQQTKLVLFGTTTALLGYLVFGFDRFAFPVLAQPLFAGVVYDLIGVPVFLLILLVIPASFAVSILRYRLWDIDLVINRALVYGTLTAILGGSYVASIALSQRAFVALTGEKSDAAIVITTLVVGSTFTHVKGKLQSVVDRYIKPIPDPIKNVQSFGEQVRAFVEMISVEQLTHRALMEVVRAFDATCGAVYLMRDGRFQPVHVHGEWSQVEGMTAWLVCGGRRQGWIALGPRRTGLQYSEQDRSLLEDVANCTAEAMQLLGTAECD